VGPSCGESLCFDIYSSSLVDKVSHQYSKDTEYKKETNAIIIQQKEWKRPDPNHRTQKEKETTKLKTGKHKLSKLTAYQNT
jgi:hypothetical protein